MLKAMMVLVITLKRIIILREDNGDVYDDGYFQLFMHSHLTGQFRENLVWFEVKPGGSHELHQNLHFLGDEAFITGALAFSGWTMLQ